MILVLQHFEVYVSSYGPQVTIFSDHSPLQFLDCFKFKKAQLTRWGLLQQEYNLDVQHVKGRQCCSRLPVSSVSIFVYEFVISHSDLLQFFFFGEGRVTQSERRNRKINKREIREKLNRERIFM